MEEIKKIKRKKKEKKEKKRKEAKTEVFVISEIWWWVLSVDPKQPQPPTPHFSPVNQKYNKQKIISFLNRRSPFRYGLFAS